MDPVTLFALANGAVSAVKAGCKLYKDIKGAAGEVKDVLKDLDDTLILMGQKRMKGINYEVFRNCVGLQYLLEPRLCTAVCLGSEDLEICGSLGSNRLLEIQVQGLTTKSGKTAGSIKPARSTWSLSGIQDTEIGHLPKLTQTILTQCWLAHPELRTPYMILDLQNWDTMPQPLVTNDIFKAVQTQQPTKTKELADVLPWDL